MQNRLRELRVDRNLTQQQLGQILGVSRQTIIAIERGRYDPSLPLALSIARFFGTCVESIFIPDESC
ncbi:MAG: helix-turn-helix transcriptional regulator [Bacillota bacterium]